MKRREFITMLGGAAAAWPMVARAQQARTRPLVGWLGGSTRAAAVRNHSAFLQGLREHGYEDGKTVDIVYRWADGDYSQLATLAKELVEINPDVIVSATTANSIALMQTTATVPIVGALVTDPIKLGQAVSYNRPGRNFTGILILIDGLPGKQAELLLQLLPHASTLGVLMNPDSPTHPARLHEIESALHKASIKIIQAAAAKPISLPTAFDTLKRNRVDGIVVLADNMFFSEAEQIVSLLAAAGIPAVHGFREHVERGGLLSYGVAIPQNFRRAAYFVDRILKGTKPGDLPIELPTKLELVINLKTAKALGLTVPPTLLATADEVIE